MLFSGHQTFPLRYAWIPKACQLIEQDADVLSDDEAAISSLGIGKNMLHSLRFWIEVTNVAHNNGGRYALTDLGKAVFRAEGHDPYLEDTRTLWLLHWHIASRHERPLFAWHYIINHVGPAEFTRSRLIPEFISESSNYGKQRSRITVAQHLDIFINSYLPRGKRKEDVLDCPLSDLNFLVERGERPDHNGRREAILAVRTGAEARIPDSVFFYCLSNFWTTRFPQEKTLTLHKILSGEGSPGAVLALGEADIRRRLERLPATQGSFGFVPSAVQPLVERLRIPEREDLIRAVYQEERA